jgi:superfamily II DNA or RNA helicase
VRDVIALAAQPPEWTYPLRRWQYEAGTQAPFRLQYQRDLCWVVTPAAGKTSGSCFLTWYLLTHRFIDGVIYLVPRAHLRETVADTYAAQGIQLDHEFENSEGSWTPEFHGAVVTYQQVALNPDVFRMLCATRRILLIGDEWHHVGDESTWGAAAREAFDDAAVRLVLSGTMFRTDETPVPYVEYDEDGAIPDYVYDYPQAIADDVCRQASFILAAGGARWVSRNGEELRHSFDDELSKADSAERLRTYVSAASFAAVIRAANEKLLAIRAEEQADAGGLVVAMDIPHARMLAAMVNEQTGTIPEIVVSTDARASERLHAFRSGDRPWLVAVQMVSEGTDVPRLRVGVNGSNVLTELFIRQFLGRFVRKQRGFRNDFAYMFAPADPILSSHVHRIHEEVKQGTKARNAQVQEEPRKPVVRGTSLYRPLDAYMANAYTVSPGAGAARSLSAQKRDLRREITRLGRHVAHQNHLTPKEVNSALVSHFGVTVDQADLEELRKRIALLNQWLTEGYSG